MMTVENHSPDSFQREKVDHLQRIRKSVSVNSSTVDVNTAQYAFQRNVSSNLQFRTLR